MQKGLVSIITPCYNMALYIHRLLDSVLSQTYDSVEMFVIDDGSTDNSFDIVTTYISRFKKRGYNLACIKQSNQGQSVAIQNGLKLVQGEFLVWPDSDDFYASSNAIEKMVHALQTASLDFGMVRVQEMAVEEATLKPITIYGLNSKQEEDFDLFEDCLFDKNKFYFVPGGYMVRMTALEECTNLKIYTEKDAGQNWQLLLPILYHYRCITIQEVLYTVVCRATSHSRGQFNTYNMLHHRLQVYERTIQVTLDKMKMDVYTKKRYKSAIQLKYLKEALFLEYEYERRSAFLKQYQLIKKQFPKDLKVADTVLLLGVYTNLFHISFIKRGCYFIYRKLKHI